jgi:SnoaL-like domain
MRGPESGLSDEGAALFQLSVEYAAAVDARDGVGFAALFEPDGELVVPSYPDELRPVVTRAGEAELRRVPNALDGYALTFHQVSNPRFDVDGDAAEGTVQCIAHHLSGIANEGGATEAGSGTDTVWFIRYEDSYRQRNGTWRFRRRVLHLQWVEHHAVERVGLPRPVDGGSG